MKYRNTRTGRIIDVNSEMRGAWVAVEPEKPAKVETAKAAPKASAKKKTATKKTGGKKK